MRTLFEIAASRPSPEATRLVICRPFSPPRGLQIDLRFFFLSRSQIASDGGLVNKVAQHFSEVFIEECLSGELRRVRVSDSLVLETIRDFVHEGQLPARRVFFLASNDTHAHTGIELLQHSPGMKFLIPHRGNKDEGAAGALSSARCSFDEIPYPPHGPPISLSASVVVAGADWTSEFGSIRSATLDDQSVTTVVYQEGPHDWGLRVPSPRGWKKLNQMRNADVALLQGPRTLMFIRPTFFSISGLPKTDERTALPLAHRAKIHALINYNFTYLDNKPDYEQRGADWLEAVISVLRSKGLDFVISVHPRAASPAGKVRAIQSNAGLIEEQLRECDLVISRFSSVVIEALAAGKQVIYFNPFFEPMATFQFPGLPSIPVARSNAELLEALDKAFAAETSDNELRRRDLDQLSWQYPTGSASVFGELISELKSNEAPILSRLAPGPAGQIYESNHRRNLSVLIVAPMPRGTYSGGRYHAWMLAIGVAAAGAEVTVLTNNFPVFIQDFKRYPTQENLRIEIATNFTEVSLEGLAFDIVVCVPGMEFSRDHYEASLLLATQNGAKLVLMNFETPNWFNKTAAPAKPSALWRHWVWLSTASDLILSATDTGTQYAREYFWQASQNGVAFASISPGVNLAEAHRTAMMPAEKRILLMARFEPNSAHKGSDRLSELVHPSWGSYVVTLIASAGESAGMSSLIETLRRQGIRYEVHTAITDRQKFSLLHESVLLVFPSTFEGFGLPPVEAAACGVPSVVFDLEVFQETLPLEIPRVTVGDFAGMRSTIAEILQDISSGTFIFDSSAVETKTVGRFGRETYELFSELADKPRPYQVNAVRHEMVMGLKRGKALRKTVNRMLGLLPRIRRYSTRYPSLLHRTGHRLIRFIKRTFGSLGRRTDGRAI